MLSCWCYHFEANNTKLFIFYNFSYNKKVKMLYVLTQLHRKCWFSFLFWGRGESVTGPWGQENSDYVEGWCEADLTRLNPVNKVLFFSPRPHLRLSNCAGTFWTSSGMCFLLISLAGLPSDRAWAAQWVGSRAQWGLLVSVPRSPVGLPSSFPQVPKGTPLEDRETKQTSIPQARGITISNSYRRTELLGC